MVIEWSEGATEEADIVFPTVGYLPIDSMVPHVSDIFSYPPAYLPNVSVLMDTETMTAYPNLMMADIAAKKAEYEKYTDKVASYTKLKTAYDKEVTALKAYYAKVDKEEEAGEKPTLPDRPVKPTLPDAYMGAYETDIIGSETGYGEITSYFLKTHFDDEGQIANPFTQKYFGLYGQGLPDDTGLGHDRYEDVDGVDNDVPDCSERFFSINLMPEEESNNLLSSVTVSIQSYPNMPIDLDELVIPTEPKNPSADPTRDEGAQFLAASAAAAISLAAMTLY